MFNIGEWNGLDWILLVILVVSTVRAWMRGLVKALFGLLGFVGGFELARWNYAPFGDWINQRQWLKSPVVAHVVAFATINIAVVVVFDLVGRGVKKSAHAVGFGVSDQMLGAAFGMVRGLLLGVALIVGVAVFEPEWVEGSRLSSYFLGVAHAVSFGVPLDLH